MSVYTSYITSPGPILTDLRVDWSRTGAQKEKTAVHWGTTVRSKSQQKSRKKDWSGPGFFENEPKNRTGPDLKALGALPRLS
jgi:hypothetical protein